MTTTTTKTASFPFIWLIYLHFKKKNANCFEKLKCTMQCANNDKFNGWYHKNHQLTAFSVSITL